VDIDVRVSGGVVRGRAAAGLAVFRGIPFATLPARFAAPAPVRAWDGVREATRFGAPPPQSALFGMDALGEEGDDWLTVNVWSPDLVGALPVMVWIQGGGYMFGTSGLPEYDGGNLGRGGVVVVTFNYRVGLEGFGFIEGLPPNRGLLDQVAALGWVQENIRTFGGDPDRVTVFGQSAGGGSVAALMAMPRAAGLFRRAIAQSVPGAYFTPALAADITRVCAAELGLDPEDLAGVDPRLLPAASDEVMAEIEQFAHRWGRAAHGHVLFAPVVDGDVLPTTPWQGLSGEVDLVVGHTRDEQRLLTVVSGMLGEITPAQAAETADLLAPDPQRYRKSFRDPGELFEVVRSDWLFRMPSLHLAESQVGAGGRAYLYELTWTAPGMGGIFGACHGLDVPLVFGNLTVGQPATLIGEPTPDAVAVSEQMRIAWTAFATDGDPGWPPYNSGTTRLLDVESVNGDYPEQVSQAIWRDPPGVLDLTDALPRHGAHP
jgi:para-nitrobenzyl esterase